MLELRPAWAEVDLSALCSNIAVLSELIAPAKLCAVVKANAYGHGAPHVARAAIVAGVDMLAVSLVEEGLELRDEGIDAPILVLSEPGKEAMAEALRAFLTPSLYSLDGVRCAAAVADRLGRRVAVHLNVDTGMHRLGVLPAELDALCSILSASRQLHLEGLYTHLSVADDPEDSFTAHQIALLKGARDTLSRSGLSPELLHAANSAGAIAHPAARLSMVRAGIALYGLAPTPGLEPAPGLCPVLSLKSRVHSMRRLPAGEATSYGRSYRLAEEAVIATVPLGYHDGVPRALGDCGGSVLINGSPRPIAGTVTMDYTLVDCGRDSEVALGDEVVFIGRQGSAQISAWDWAIATGTIAYEILSGISARVPRRIVGTAAAVRASRGFVLDN